jgi:carotenoid cleavage dioxygenase
MTKPFPRNPHYSGFNAPFRMECDLFDLEIEGEIPEDIHGTWYRCGPDPQFSPKSGDDDIFINGDGMMSMFRFENRHADFKMRYVRTERYIEERKVRRSLYGVYRNPFTDDPSVKGKDRGTANTTAWWHAGKLYALKEDSLPYEVNPDTLETIGRVDFDGLLKSKTVTAHPKYDPITEEWVFFGYEASGDATKDISYCVVDKTGKLVREDWFEAPYPSFMHDFAITQDYVIFPVYPATTNMERLKAGKQHWVWDESLDTYIGIMKRNGSVEDIKWFKRPPCYSFHVQNAFNEGTRVHLDLCVSEVPAFPYITDENGERPANPLAAAPFLTRWTFDMEQSGDTFEEKKLSPIPGELPRVNDREMSLPYQNGYYVAIDNTKPLHTVGPMLIGPNTLAKINVESGELKTYYFGDQSTLQEPQFVPSLNGEGYICIIIDEHDKNESYVAIMDAEKIEKGPIAKCKLPIRLRNAFHGCWVSAEKLPTSK